MPPHANHANRVSVVFRNFLPHFCRGLKGTSKSVLYRCIWNENLIFQTGDQATPLTSEKLQHLTYWQSFQYATATKAPRLPAVLQYASRLANVAIGFSGYLFMERPSNRFRVPADEDGLFRQENGDSRVMPGFNPYTISIQDATGCFPVNASSFHPHVAA
jgi:Piwi domain